MEHALAFAMGTHGRLGAASPVRCLAGEVGLLRMIVGGCRKWVGGVAGRQDGLLRLLGGGFMLMSVRGLMSLSPDSAEGGSNPVARSGDKGSRPTDLQDDDDEIEEERMTTSEAEELLRQADSEAENNACF